METIDDPWLILGLKQIDLLEQDAEAYMSCLVGGGAILGIWKMVYLSAVRLKRLVPIEKVPQDVKEKLWLEANELGGKTLGKEGLIDLSKALLTIKVFLGKL